MTKTTTIFEFKQRLINVRREVDSIGADALKQLSPIGLHAVTNRLIGIEVLIDNTLDTLEHAKRHFEKKEKSE
jgi:hypothetical protein